MARDEGSVLGAETDVAVAPVIEPGVRHDRPYRSGQQRARGRRGSGDYGRCDRRWGRSKLDRSEFLNRRPDLGSLGVPRGPGRRTADFFGGTASSRPAITRFRTTAPDGDSRYGRRGCHCRGGRCSGAD